MANVTIPNLTSATSITPSSDLLVVEQTNGTRKATASQLFTSSATSGSALGITSGGVYTVKQGLQSSIDTINDTIGTDDISEIGTSVTNAISELNVGLTEITTNLEKLYTDIYYLGTTDAGGDMDIPVSGTGHKVLYAYSNANYFVLVRYVDARNCWGVKIISADDMQPVANTSCTIYYAVTP